MKYSIGTLLLLTLIAAIVANIWLQRLRIERAQAAIQEISLEIKLFNFEEEHVDSHTRVCELAIANNPLPSPYYLAAKQRFEELAGSDQDQNK